MSSVVNINLENTINTMACKVKLSDLLTDELVTKRRIISYTTKLFDPLGWM